MLILTGWSLCLGQVKSDPPYWFDDANDDATIYFLSSDDVTENGYLAIYGDDFRNSGRVTLNGSDAPVELWTNRKIIIRVPSGSSGPVSILPEGGTVSEEYPVSVHGGNVYHLDGQAPAGGDGSAAAPWNLFESANQAVRAGDFVVVHGGVYRGSGEYNWDVDPSGSAGNSITFFAMPGEVVEIDGSSVTKIAIRIDGSYINMVGFVASSSQYMNIYINGDHSRAVDCDVRDGDGSVSGKGQGINIMGAGAQAIGNYIHDNYSHGFYIHADDMEIGYNYVSNSGCCGAPAAAGYGIQLYLIEPGPVFSGSKVYRNYVTGANRSGIVVGLYADDTDLYENIITGNRERGIIVNYGATNTLIRNNVFYGNDTASAGYYEIDLYEGDNTTVMNNVISGPLAIRKYNSVSGSVRIDSNFYDGTTRWEWNSSAYSSLAQWISATGMDASSLTGDPDYRDPQGDDYRPGDQSPLIDAGDNGYCARPPLGDRCDVGAFETTGVAVPPAAPSTPENVHRTDTKS
jgi:parallel beta-helix repeat protein